MLSVGDIQCFCIGFFNLVVYRPTSIVVITPIGQDNLVTGQQHTQLYFSDNETRFASVTYDCYGLFDLLLFQAYQGMCYETFPVLFEHKPNIMISLSCGISHNNYSSLRLCFSKQWAVRAICLAVFPV